MQTLIEYLHAIMKHAVHVLNLVFENLPVFLAGQLLIEALLV